MDTLEFLRTVVTAEQGYFCLMVGPPHTRGWRELWFKWPEDIDQIVPAAMKLSSEANIYFSSYLFASRHSLKSEVLPSRTLQADLDDADILTLPVAPSILVESSPGRHQGYWLLKQELDLVAHETLSRQLSYAIPKCDRCGWSLGRKVRVPGTFNHKYAEGVKEVRIISAPLKVYTLTDFGDLPQPPSIAYAQADEDFLEKPPSLEIGPQELLETIREKLPPKVVAQYNVATRDRSAALWALQCSAFRVGLDRDQVYWLAKHSANNKFADVRYHAERELAKDVLRAEAAVKNKAPDVRSIIMEIRKLPGFGPERKQFLLQKVLDFMRETGEFVHAKDDSCWYIRRDTGRPVRMATRSEYLTTILDLHFGLNSTEADQSYVIQGLCSYVHALPTSGLIGSLSTFDMETRSLLLHLGSRDILRITPESITPAIDGAYGVVFPWLPTVEPFTPVYDGVDWSKELFGNFDNLTGLTKNQGAALLTVWFLFLLVRDAAVSRPILALFGQPGAGKSTLLRRVYAMLYGRQRAIGSITSPDDFDHAVSVDPFVAFDNVDSWERWLPDRLALSASTSDVTKRKLYTDLDTIVMKRQALVALSAHNPRFGREDVADRLLLLTFQRLGHFTPEGSMMETLLGMRNRLWGSVIRDVQRVLQSPLPSDCEVPQFRIEDFARLGLWIARALGIEGNFRSALDQVASSQKEFSLEEDHLLVSSLQQVIRRAKEQGKWYSPAQLWSELEGCSQDVMAFQRTYKSAVYLSKKLWALHTALGAMFQVEWKVDTTRGTKVWRFKLKEQEDA